MFFYGKLANILGVNAGIPLGVNKEESDDFNYDKDIVTYAPHQSDIHGGFYTLYIYKDIIDYQSVGDAYVPLLGSAHIAGKNKHIVCLRYDKVHYISINKSTITDIVVEVKDDQNKDVEFSYGKVCVKLHFRPVRHGFIQ